MKMKTKHVFIALCLPTLFAACSSEELIDNGGSNALNGRAKVNLKVSVSPDNQANTRITPDGNGDFLWQPTDQLGAVIVDPATLNTVAGSAHLVNNRFKNDLTTANKTANFYTDGTTVEGAWMFYYPYSNTMSTSRNGIAFGEGDKCIKAQKYDNDGTLMAGNDFKVSPVIFVDANEGGETNVTIKPASIYAYGIINAKLPAGATTVNRVVIAGASDAAFNVSGKIDATKVVAKAALNYSTKKTGMGEPLNTYEDAIEASTDDDGLPDASLAEAAFADQTKVYATGDVTDFFQSGVTTSKYIIMECTTEGQGVVPANGEFSSRILLPAGKYTSAIDVYFYTNAGVYKKTIAANALIKRNHTVNLADVNRTTVSEEDPNAYKTAKWTIEPGDKVTSGAPIVTTDDLVSVIKGTATDLNVSGNLVTDARVEFNDAVATALAENANLTKLTVSDIDVTCGTETAAVAIGKLTVVGTVTVKSNSNVILNGTNTFADLVIEKDAKVEIAAGTYSKTITSAGTLLLNCTIANAVITNTGTMTIAAPVAKANPAPIEVVKIANNGTVNVNALATITTLTNGTAAASSPVPAIDGTVNINADATITTLTNVAGTVTNLAELTVNGGENGGAIVNSKKFIAATAEFSNKGIFTNTGIIDGAGFFVNLGVLNNNSVDGGTVSIKANGLSTSMTTEGDADAKIYPMSGSMTTVADNYGSIYFTDGAMIASPKNNGMAGHKRYGHVVYTYGGTTAEGLNTAFEATVCSKLVLTKDFTIEATKAITVNAIKVIEVEGGTMTVNEDQTLFHCPIFVAGNATLKGAKTLSMDDTRLVVDAGKILTINGGKIAGAGSIGLEIANNGEVRNFGSVTGVKGDSSTNNGTWTGTAWVEKI